MSCPTSSTARSRPWKRRSRRRTGVKTGVVRPVRRPALFGFIVICRTFRSGAEGIRTPDLRRAKLELTREWLLLVASVVSLIQKSRQHLTPNLEGDTTPKGPEKTAVQAEPNVRKFCIRGPNRKRGKHHKRLEAARPGLESEPPWLSVMSSGSGPGSRLWRSSPCHTSLL